MNTELLTALLGEYGLSAHKAEILTCTRPAVFLKLDQPGQGEIGQSRIGGTPDLPSSMTWPQSTRWGKYLYFILQINLAQLPTFADSPFPPRGMLYLFVSESEDAAEQILLWTGDEVLQPRAQPNSEDIITDWYEELVPHTLTFNLAPDILRWATTDFYEMCDRLTIDEEYLDDVGRAYSKNTVGKLLGYTAGIGHDPRQDAYVVRDVNPQWIYDYEQRKTLDMTHAQRWRNLLRVDSNRAVNLWFGDAGYLQVLAHEDDLSRMMLSRVYVNLESS